DRLHRRGAGEVTAGSYKRGRLTGKASTVRRSAPRRWRDGREVQLLRTGPRVQSLRSPLSPEQGRNARGRLSSRHADCLSRVPEVARLQGVRLCVWGGG